MSRVTSTTARRVRAVCGHVVATAVVVLPAGVHTYPEQGVVWDLRVLVLNAAAAAVLLARRRAPRAVLAVIVVLALVSLPLGVFNAGVSVAAAVATYAVTLRTTRTRATVTTVAVAAGMLVGAWVAVDGHTMSNPGGPAEHSRWASDGPGAPHMLVVLLGGVLGDAIRTQRAHVAAITERAERAERTREALARQRVAEDRLAIARDLHDVVAHQIAVINLHAGVASAALRDRPDDAEKSLVVVRDSARTVLAEIGDLLATLRDPSTADATGGLAQLDDVVRDFQTHGLDVTVCTDGDVYELPAAVDVTALRVVAEALTNAHKHGSERRAHVQVQYLPGMLRITVANPAAGHDDPSAALSDALALGTGNGLTGMRERVESVRGTLSTGYDDGSGTWQVVADLPTVTRAHQRADARPQEHP
ncbi:MAG: histidine kinase [Micrococcales bacterium]|nr:histidine kinase [Micrococcales bacterium]MCL2668969.1 histidine kinase [Micrococcales bacterium]